jgi:hypothetical protein
MHVSRFRTQSFIYLLSSQLQRSDAVIMDADALLKEKVDDTLPAYVPAAASTITTRTAASSSNTGTYGASCCLSPEGHCHDDTAGLVEETVITMTLVARIDRAAAIPHALVESSSSSSHTGTTTSSSSGRCCCC